MRVRPIDTGIGAGCGVGAAPPENRVSMYFTTSS
jgi:hypothetical protein